MTRFVTAELDKRLRQCLQLGEPEVLFTFLGSFTSILLLDVAAVLCKMVFRPLAMSFSHINF